MAKQRNYRRYNLEEKENAECLFVVDGLTTDEVAVRTGIGRATIHKWSVDGGWVAMRKTYQTAQADIRRKSILLQKELITKALETLDPQIVYAAARFEPSYNRTGRSDAGDKNRIFLEVVEFIANWLKANDPAGMSVIARHIGALTKAWKEQDAT